MSRWLQAVGFAVALAASGCHPSRTAPPSSDARIHLVFKQQPMWGEPAAFRGLLRRFEQANPSITVEAQYLPNASDLAHQYYLTALGGGAADFDVLVIDVIWVPEFAHAGWIADVSDAFPPAQLRRDFLPGPAAAVVVDGRSFAVPWYVDVGLLYYRSDLVPRAPRTFEELDAFARAAMARHPGLSGYVWQGRQYEGLDCNVFEAIWNHGGDVMGGDRVVIDSPQARAALAWMHQLLVSGISPPSVTAAAEEESRRIFHQGRAVFMRNWPYAWNEAQAPDSPIRGKVGFAALPTVNGEPGAGALGGWQLAVNANIAPERRRAAQKLIAFLSSPEAERVLAITYSRNPARRGSYTDPELERKAPFIAHLLPIVERARPRPVTPYYDLIADILQGEFSAAISGLRTPAESLNRAQRLVDHLTGAAR